MVTLEDMMRMHERHTTALISAVMASAVFQKTEIGDEDPKVVFLRIFSECDEFLKKA